MMTQQTQEHNLTVPDWLRKLTRKDFQRLAKAAQAMQRTLSSEQLDALVDQLALACQDLSTPGVFNYDRFCDACNEPLPPSTITAVPL